MRELLMKMKSALVGLVLGGLSMMLRNANADPGITPIDTIIRQVTRASRYRPAFNGGLPSVKLLPSEPRAALAGWATHESPPAGYRRHDGRGLPAGPAHRWRSGACALGLHSPAR